MLNLDPGTFGGTKACHVLVDLLNKADDKILAKNVVSAFNKYFETVGELLKLDNPTRDIMLRLWLEDTMVRSQVPNGLKEKFDRNGINFTYFHNILLHRMRQAMDHGALLEKFRGKETEHHEVLYELRMLAKAKAGR